MAYRMLAIKEKKTTPIPSNLIPRALNPDGDLACSLIKRRHLEKPLADFSASSLNLRRESYSQYVEALSTLEPRFPIALERCGLLSLPFTWHDAFNKSKKETQTSIRFEKAAAVFNLGAIYSQIAEAADRSSTEGIKKACNAFQSAAGALKFVKDSVLDNEVVLWASVDLSPECVGMLEKLMLAQAQECFFEMAVWKGMSPGGCSKVARQVGFYYEEVYGAITSPPLNNHFDRTWASHVHLKSSLFYAEACYRYSLRLHEEKEIGEEIARLSIGINKISIIKKNDAVSKLEKHMKLNLKKATKENNQIYCTRVPMASNLTDLPAVSLAKSIIPSVMH